MSARDPTTLGEGGGGDDEPEDDEPDIPTRRRQPVATFGPDEPDEPDTPDTTTETDGTGPEVGPRRESGPPATTGEDDATTEDATPDDTEADEPADQLPPGVQTVDQQSTGPGSAIERAREAAARGRRTAARGRQGVADIFRDPGDFDIRGMFGPGPPAVAGGPDAGEPPETDFGGADDRVLGAFDDARTEARSSEERRARNQLAAQSELIDPEDVVFVERNGQVVATVDAETATLLAASGFRQDDFVIEGGLAGETGGGEDLAFARGGDPMGEILAEAEGNLEEAVGVGRAEAAGIVNPALREGIIEGVDLDANDIDIRSVEGGFLAALTDERATVESERAAEAGGIPADARSKLEQQLEEQTGVDLDPGTDITFEQEDGQVTGELTEEGRKAVAVERAPFTDAPIVGPAFETGAEIDFEFDIFRERNREAFFDVVSQREEALEALDDVGLREEFDTFQDVSARAQADLDAIKERVESIDVRDVGTGLIAAGAAGVVAPEPVTSVGGAGAVVAGGGLLVGSAVAGAAASVDRDAPPVETATFDVFPPEHETPDRPADSPFEPELVVGPSSLDLPELLPPTTEAGQLRRGRFTPPEIAVPTEPAEVMPPEIETPDEPIDDIFGGAEVEVPTLFTGPVQRARQRDQPDVITGEDLSSERAISDIGQTGSAFPARGVGESVRKPEKAGIGEQGEFVGSFTRQQDPAFGGTGKPNIQFERNFPEGAFTEIPGLVERGEGGAGFSVIFRPSPRSFDLRQIETPFATIELGAELTRVLDEQALSADIEPLEEPIERVGTRPVDEQRVGVAGAQAEDLDVQLDLPSLDLPSLDVEVDVAQEVQRDRPQRTATTVEFPSVEVPRIFAPGTPNVTVLEDEPIRTAFETRRAGPKRPARLPRFDFDLGVDEPSFRDIDTEVHTGVFEHKVPTVKQFEKKFRKRFGRRKRKSRQRVDAEPVEAPGIDMDLDLNLDDIDPFP